MTALVGRYIGMGRPDISAKRANLGFVVAAQDRHQLVIAPGAGMVLSVLLGMPVQEGLVGLAVARPDDLVGDLRGRHVDHAGEGAQLVEFENYEGDGRRRYAARHRTGHGGTPRVVGVRIGRGTTAELLDLPGNPHRTIFTSVRRSSAKRPAILAARETLAAAAEAVAGNDAG